MQASPDWYKTFFSGLAVEMWLRAMPAEMTALEVEFLRAKLGVAPGAKLLDVPCGGGRLSHGLATAGYAMTCVDISPAFLAAARAKMVEPIEFHERDMTDLPWTNKFDGAFCFGNSFGYLSDDDNAWFFQAVAQALKPGARFVLDYPAVAENVLPIFQPQSAHQLGDIKFERNGRYDPATGRIVVEHTFTRGDRTEKSVMTQRVYTYREVCALLAKAGFGEMQGYGGLADEPFALGSKRFLLVATKQK